MDIAIKIGTIKLDTIRIVPKNYLSLYVINLA